MFKVLSNKHPVIGDEKFKFTKVSFIHPYPNPAAVSDNHYLRRITFAKTQQSVKTSGVKISTCPIPLKNEQRYS